MSDSDVDVDMIHRAAQLDEDQAERALQARLLSAGTHIMIAHCIFDKIIDDWEKNTRELDLTTNNDGVILEDLSDKSDRPP